MEYFDFLDILHRYRHLHRPMGRKLDIPPRQASIIGRNGPLRDLLDRKGERRAGGSYRRELENTLLVDEMADVEVANLNLIYFYSLGSSFTLGFSIYAPDSAGIKAPLGGVFFDLKSSQIASMVTHSMPSCLLIFSMILRASQHAICGRHSAGQTYLSNIINP